MPDGASATSTKATRIRTISPTYALSGKAVSRSDLSGLDWDSSRNVLFAIWEGANLLGSLNREGRILHEWTSPGTDQEGVSVSGDRIYIDEDNGAVKMYVGFRPKI